MTNAEERTHYEQTKEQNLRYIRGKIVCASARELGLIAAFIQGLGVVGMALDG